MVVEKKKEERKEGKKRKKENKKPISLSTHPSLSARSSFAPAAHSSATHSAEPLPAA